MLAVDPHPLLELAAVEARWAAPLGELSSPPWLRAMVGDEVAPALPAPTDEQTRSVRDLLRHGGFKPSGRNKPCNEYIRKAVAKGRFPWINPAVDATNVAVFHSGLPVSTVDLDRTVGALRVGIADPGASYVFNPSGQVIDLSGLLCLFDEEGPCANAVKDAQRTKTHDGTVRTLTLLWGTAAWPGRTEAAAAWTTAQLERIGATARRCPVGS